MKKLLYIALTGLLIATVTTSCEDYLEAPAKSTLDESVIFSTYDLAKGAVDGIKVSFAETNSYRGRFLPWYGMNTDVEWNNSSENTDDNYDLVKYNAKPINDQMNTTNNAWAKMYEGIERANICIRGLRAFGNTELDAEMAHLLGEALTLRAIYYADLVKTWGDVPLRFEPITTETLYLPKSSRDEIYKQLLMDLEEAATLVPWPNETANTAIVERVNKAFVKGLRARLALAAGGYSQYPDGIRLSNDPELEREAMYEIALKESQEVIESGTAHLESSFEQLWRKFNEDNINAGGESLWEVPFSPGRGRWLFTFAIRHNSVDKYTGQPRGGQSGPLPYLFYDYDAKDVRRDITCVPYEWKDVRPATDIAEQEPTGLDTWAFGKFRYEWKNVYVTSSNDDGTNFMYMRYAEILMMAAEAALELGDESSAKSYLKEVRRRAFNEADWTSKVDAYVDGLSGTALFDAIVEEHKLEFCGEMQRKQALIRWNLLKDKLDEAKDKMYDLRNKAGDYADVPETLYYRLASDNETLEFYGLERGQTEDKSSEYSDSMNWAVPESLEDNKIESMYDADPNTRQFWPIWQVFVDGSNGQLVNDYGY